MSTTGTTARQKLTAKIKAMSTGMLMVSADDLGARPELDEAEKLVLLGITAEYRTRLAALAKATTTEALLTDYRRIEALEYATLPRTTNTLYWVLDDELQRRYPKAATATDEWLLSSTATVGYGAKFLSMIEEIQA